MNKLFYYNICILICLLPWLGLAQTAELSFLPISGDGTHHCYEIQLKASSDIDVLLSSQNFRFYYDASKSQFDRESVISLLPASGYSDIKVMQVIHNSNASGYGNLNFGGTLGFVNLAITDKMKSADMLSLVPHELLSLARFCMQDLDNAQEPSLIWARSPLTSGYSSAYTEIAWAHLKAGGVIPKIHLKDMETSTIDVENQVVGMQSKL